MEAQRGQERPRIVVAPPGPRSRELGERLAGTECPAVDARRDARAKQSGEEQAPIVYARGVGANVEDVDGNRYVDLTAGFGALLLGHGAPEVTRAMVEQQDRLWLALGDVYASEAKVRLCEELAALYPEPRARVLLGTSGADAITAALKTAVLATGKSGVVAFEGAYHGLSYAPLAACGLAPGFREPFAAQLGDHVSFAPYPESDASLEPAMTVVREALARGAGAVLVEPVLGRGGCVVPPASFLTLLRRACDDAGALLVCDEIWTGLGRSGHWLASRAAGVVADVVCLGKGLGGGMPVSACVGSARAMEAWGTHGGTAIHTATHFGAPLGCSTALATIATLRTRELSARALGVGARWVHTLEERTKGRGVRGVRGSGLMVGVVLEGGAARALAMARRMLGLGYIVLTGGVRGDTITLTPPLDIDESLLDAFADALAEAL